ncbi:hypothetical protein PR048_014979 [Dryococelus australis]|uniref:Uncharacterized protein n=1 Tax=Dryococelus australis TaxID=614101 RepID=A0ABQ9HFN9_9NEOP|nr:hypothetical protein PR048_014979 [Dryococelus australis]
MSRCQPTSPVVSAEEARKTLLRLTCQDGGYQDGGCPACRCFPHYSARITAGKWHWERPSSHYERVLCVKSVSRWRRNNRRHSVLFSLLHANRLRLFNVKSVTNTDVVHPIGGVAFVGLVSSMRQGVFAKAKVPGGYLNEMLPQRWIDLTPCDCFLWGYIEDQVFRPPLPASIDDLEQRVTDAIQTVTRGKLTRVWNEFEYRIDTTRRLWLTITAEKRHAYIGNSLKAVHDKANRVRFPEEVAPGFSHVGIVPDDAAGWRVFSGISRFPPVSPVFCVSYRVGDEETSLMMHLITRVFSPDAVRGDSEPNVSDANWRLACSPPTKANNALIPGPVTPEFSHVGIVPDDAAGRRVFSGIPPFPPLLTFRRCSTHLTSPSSALKISMLRAAQISSLTHLLGLIGPFIFPGRLTGVVFLHILHEELPLLLGDIPLAVRRRTIFQHDGGPPHFHHAASLRRKPTGSAQCGTARLGPTRLGSGRPGSAWHRTHENRCIGTLRPDRPSVAMDSSSDEHIVVAVACREKFLEYYRMPIGKFYELLHLPPLQKQQANFRESVGQEERLALTLK